MIKKICNQSEFARQFRLNCQTAYHKTAQQTSARRRHSVSARAAWDLFPISRPGLSGARGRATPTQRDATQGSRRAEHTPRTAAGTCHRFDDRRGRSGGNFYRDAKNVPPASTADCMRRDRACIAGGGERSTRAGTDTPVDWLISTRARRLSRMR